MAGRVGPRFSLPVRRFIRSARVAHLATAGADGQPLVVPICFVFDGTRFYSPVDEKPKRVSPDRLKRMRNIRENPRVSLVVDRYEEDWKRLAYVLVAGTAEILMRGPRHRKAVRLLRRKYSQYRRMAIEERPLIAIAPRRVAAWGSL
ncbi:MAG TPA: TIGR03668 family PPOX class F420-dependent oxidoreductase [candidate division Zixibacteria bacterium]|nr:TIGR03668 family PPOX class F420-dependent oxidoreductase [candidate division Zixibacteria bacterium]